jgi:hypothetical protein
VIDCTAEEIFGITQNSIVDFDDFQVFYFEIFSRVQPEPNFKDKVDDLQMSSRDEANALNTEFDNQRSDREQLNLIKEVTSRDLRSPTKRK